jgi:hypothetical protein
MRQKNFFWLGFLLMLGMSAYFFQHLFEHPNGFMGVNGDGYKNYSTVEYHVKNDATYMYFEGMNYPYGDHLVFADAQPILANTIKFFSRHLFDVSDHTRAILHSFLLSSLLLCYCFIYLIFRHLNIQEGYASLSAAAIAWLSPQLARWNEHYALGYVFILPLLLYLLLIFQKKRTIFSSIQVGILTFFVAQIHLYYFGILLLFVSLFHLYDFFFTKKQNDNSLVQHIKKNILSSILAYTLQTVLPAIYIIFYWLKIGDTVVDRPSVPGGFLTYRALWQGVFISPNSLLYRIFQWEKPPIFSLMENVVYFGMAATIGFLILILNKKIFSNTAKILNHERITEINLNAFLFASFPLFLLAFGLPFIFSDWEKYLVFTGSLQQFRGVGRFAWVFFYVINIYVFYKTNERYVWILILLAWADVLYLRHEPLQVLPANFFTKQIQPNDFEQNIDWKKYQAILPLPYFNIGSEQFDINPEGYTLPYTFYFSIEKNIPYIGAQMSRTSFEQAYKLQRFGAFQNSEKPNYTKDLNSKPILLIQNKKEGTKDTTYQQWNGFILKKLHENNTLCFYELYLQSFQTDISSKTHLLLPKMYLCEDNIVFKGHIENQKILQKNTLCFDWLCEQQTQPLLEYHIRELDAKTGAQLQFNHYGCRYYRTDMSNNHFVHCEIPFETWYEDSEIEVTLFYHKAPKNVELIVRDLEIKNDK